MYLVAGQYLHSHRLKKQSNQLAGQQVKFGTKDFALPVMVHNSQITQSYIPNDGSALPLKAIEPTGSVIPIGYPQFHKTTLDKAISTAGITQCSVLVVINTKENWHYMAHINPTTDRRILERHFKNENLDIPGSEFYLLPGRMLDSTESTVEETLRGLHAVNPDLPSQMQFVYIPKDSWDDTVVTYKGDIGYLVHKRHGQTPYTYERGGQLIPGTTLPGGMAPPFC